MLLYRWALVARDVNGRELSRSEFVTRRGAERMSRRLVPLAFNGRPMWTNSVERAR